MTRITRLFVFAASASALGGAALAQEKDLPNDLPALTKVFTDSQAPLANREQALLQATALVRNKGETDYEKKRLEPFKKEIPPLIMSLHAKRLDPTYNKFTMAAIVALDPFTPYPDLAPLVRPYLKAGTPEIVRLAALEAIENHGGKGLGKDLAAMMEEPVTGKRAEKRSREKIERNVVRATRHIPADESVLVLTTALRKTTFKGVKLVATNQLGELQSTREGAEMTKGACDLAEKALKEVSLASYPDIDVACFAALTLMRYGSWDGIGQVMERIKGDKRGGSRETYKCICTAARKPKGFLDVPAERFYEIDSATRQSVLGAMNEWWDKAKTTKPDTGLFEAMKAAGIQVPTDLNSKDAVSALIDALDLENRELRYEALDLLIRKTGRTDFGKEFKSLVTGGGPNALKITQMEPMEGFPPGSELERRLMDQQKERAKQFRSWWQSNMSKATWDGTKKAWIVEK